MARPTTRRTPFGVPLSTAQVVSRYACPACGAGPGKVCARLHGIGPDQAHLGRWRAASLDNPAEGAAGDTASLFGEGF
ncbi:hypothetical protein [Azospirillum sp. B4]|uniref:zinc finger domain-containing protein n=1 Tax=Azospirillum sp. B4 TaxID=95605 RepID=UPI00034518C2|nr:hypothetical protein [Azospirillum sp. B4]